VAGAGGFEPPHGGTKIRCLTAWLRPNRNEPCARIIWSFGGAQGLARSSNAAKDISRLAANTAACVLARRRVKARSPRLIAAPFRAPSTPASKPFKRPLWCCSSSNPAQSIDPRSYLSRCLVFPARAEILDRARPSEGGQISLRPSQGRLRPWRPGTLFRLSGQLPIASLGRRLVPAPRWICVPLSPWICAAEKAPGGGLKRVVTHSPQIGREALSPWARFAP
jgi:hypothetical protein